MGEATVLEMKIIAEQKKQMSEMKGQRNKRN